MGLTKYNDIRILIAEDDEDDLWFFRELIYEWKNWDYYTRRNDQATVTVDSALTREDVIQKLSEFHYDLLFLDYHQRFIATIEDNRKQLSRDQIKKLADGRIYTSQQALDAKLIDQIAYMDEAEEFIQKDLRLDEMRLVIYHRAGQYKSNIYSSPPVPPSINFNFVNLNFIPETPGPNFMYLWMP